MDRLATTGTILGAVAIPPRAQEAWLQPYVDAKITPCFLAGERHAKRSSLADGLKIVVDKRLSRSRQTMAEMVNSRI